MIDSILKKIGLGGNKPDIPVVNVKSKSLIDVLRDSGLSEANEKKLTLNGNNDSAVLIELDKVLIAKQCDSKKIVILFNDHTDIRDLFKIAVLFKVKKIFNFVNNDNNINYSKKTNIKFVNSEIHLMLDVAMENKEEFIFAVNQSTDLHQLKQIINDICITECVTNFDNITDHTQFAKNISEHNCGQLVNSLYNHKEFIGFSCSNSILDSFQNGTKILLRNIINKNPIKQFPVVNEMELMKKMQGGNLNFEDMLYAFKKVEEIGTSSIGSMLGIKITPDIIKGLNQQKAIINSMTKKERNNPTIINQSRIERISKGSGVSIEMVKKLLETINYMKGNAGNFMKMMSNPSMMANFLGKSN